MMTQFTGILTNFIVFESKRNNRIGHGYRVIYENKRGVVFSNTTLVDDDGFELPEGPYRLLLQEDRMVVVLKGVQ